MMNYIKQLNQSIEIIIKMGVQGNHFLVTLLLLGTMILSSEALRSHLQDGLTGFDGNRVLIEPGWFTITINCEGERRTLVVKKGSISEDTDGQAGVVSHAQLKQGNYKAKIYIGQVQGSYYGYYDIMYNTLSVGSESGAKPANLLVTDGNLQTKKSRQAIFTEQAQKKDDLYSNNFQFAIQKTQQFRYLLKLQYNDLIMLPRQQRRNNGFLGVQRDCVRAKYPWCEAYFVSEKHYYEDMKDYCFQWSLKQH